jgi:DGQHR domain-containing protein
MIELRVYPVQQPIGTFYVGVMDAADVCRISNADVRRLKSKDREVELYSGIQRRLDLDRELELAQYVGTEDATFPTSIILAIDERCARLEGDVLTLHAVDDEDPPIPEDQIAKVLDGQHRIAGLRAAQPPFQVNVALFIGLDIADQAMIFATVNLAQTKVNRSLAIDLYDYERVRSPIRTCHTVVVKLDQEPDSPLFHRIKRLGFRTEGRAEREFVSQATIVDSLVKYITDNPIRDRDTALRNAKLPLPDQRTANRLIFRSLFIQDEDEIIANVVWNFFDAVRDRWPVAWGNPDPGWVLTRTNGFRAFLRFLRPAYVSSGGPAKRSVSRREFRSLLEKIEMPDEDFRSDKYLPGTSGETALYKDLLRQSGLADSGRED